LVNCSISIYSKKSIFAIKILKMFRNIIFLIVICFSFSLVAQKNSRSEDLIKKLSHEKNTFMNAVMTEKLLSYLDDRMVFIHSNGMTESKDEMIQNLKAGKWNIEKVEWKNSSVRIFKNNVAILIGKGTFHVNSDGQHKDLDLYFTEVWTHYKKGWQLSSRHANKI
jgi:Domain of unknown function (DUF4440)